MSRKTWIRILGQYGWPLLTICLSSCTNQPLKRFHFYSERITSQQASPVVLYIEPIKNPSPTYNWMGPHDAMITQYAFHCHGTGEELIIESKHLFDCQGLRHSLYKDFFINPRLVMLARWLQKVCPVHIIEGFCCQRHFTYLQHLGWNPPIKLLSGEAMILALPPDLSKDQLLSALTTFYTKHKTPLSPTQFIQKGSQLLNNEFAITYLYQEAQLILTVELV